MRRAVISAIYLFAAALMIAGAFGHGFIGRHALDAELARHPLRPEVGTMLYVVWYFVSGCMLVFGLIAIWAWSRLRRGERAPMFAVHLIAALYVATGVGGLIYRHGDPFQLVFVAKGVALAACGAWLSAAAARRPPDRAGG